MENAQKSSDLALRFEELRHRIELKLINVGVEPLTAQVLAGDLVLELYGSS